MVMQPPGCQVQLISQAAEAAATARRGAVKRHTEINQGISSEIYHIVLEWTMWEHKA